MRQNKKINQTTFIVCIAIIAVIIVGLIVAMFFESGDGRSDYDYKKDDIVYYNDEEYLPKGNLYTLLIAGTDNTGKVEEKEYNNAGQCDFIALIIMDRSSKTYKILEINRDTMTNIPVLGLQGDKTDTVYAQIALSHSYGDGLKVSCKNVKNAVSDYLYGIDIDDYMIFNIDAIGLINDAVGGVEVTLDEDFTEYDKTMKKGAKLRLTGSQAIIYTRQRREVGDNTNASRMSRQENYIKEFLPIAKAAMNENQQIAVEIFDSLQEYMVTSMNKSQFGGLVNKMYSYENEGFITIEGESVKGEEFIEFYPDEKDLKAKVIDLFYKKA
ncbi:MAG: LCP family protein [Firmicutes bacterium]|nr:LCP family protein [Bacillota bacterium]